MFSLALFHLRTKFHHFREVSSNDSLLYAQGSEQIEFWLINGFVSHAVRRFKYFFP